MGIFLLFSRGQCPVKKATIEPNIRGVQKDKTLSDRMKIGRTRADRILSERIQAYRTQADRT